MKKLLSIILALSMLAAFVPAVSAEAADAQPNFTIKYDITKDLADTNAASFSAINLAYTNGFYALGTAGFYGEWNTSSDYFKPYGTGENMNVAMRNALHSGVKVWVPMAGTYTLKVNYATGLAFSQNEMRVFWHKETYDRSSSSRVGTYKSPEGSYSATEIWSDQFVKIHSEPFTATVTADAPGYYYVGFEVGGSSSGQTSGLYQRASFASISLVSGSGDGNAIVLGSIAAPFELKKDETKELNASGYLSQTREAVTFKYESDDETVAKVSEDGTVTAVGAGTATITATSANDEDNVTVPLTTTVTVTDPDAYTVTYDIGGTITRYGMNKDTTGLHMYNVKYLHTNGFFEYVSADPTVNGQSNAEYQTGTKTLAMNKAGGYVTFKINVPYGGNYKLWMDHDLALEGAYVDVIIDGNTVGTYNCYSANAEKAWFGTTGSRNHTQSIAKVYDAETNELGEDAVFPLTAGAHTIEFANKTGIPVAASRRGSVGTFKLIKGGSSNVLPMHGFATVSNSDGVPVTDLLNGQTATASAAVYTTDAQAAATATTITSSNPAVLKVDGTTVTAVGAGKATINASIEYDDTTYDVVSNEILVTDPAITNNTISFYADATEDVALSISGISYNQGDINGTVSANSEVTLVAPTDIEGKTFRGWMRGSKDNGVWISNESEITVTLVSNTFLTAVYDVAETENQATVEFWNWSGQYLGSKTVDKGTEFSAIENKPAPHPLTGYNWTNGWSVDNNTVINGLTRAVAQFEKTAGKFNVTILDEDLTVVAEGDYEFDTKVTLTSNSGKVYWLRDGKTVDYGTEYSFYVWDDTVITTSPVGNSAPKVILDKHEDYGSYMIEFDKGEAENMRIIEAGILFGTNPTVTTFDSKAVASGRDLTHGQFTAVANTTNGGATNAVGYIVYLDGGTARVLYAYDN